MSLDSKKRSAWAVTWVMQAQKLKPLAGPEVQLYHRWRKSSYHFSTSDKLDPYVGAIIGYNIASVTAEKPAGYVGPDLPEASAGGFIIGGHLGARYMFTDKLGAFGELGYGIAYLQLGVTAKF
jgi:hypothetical protein